MKERIQQLAQGIIQTAVPELVFFPDKLNREIPVDAVISLDVQVKSRNKVPFKGFFYSSDDRVRVCTAGVAGQNGSVTLEISTRNCEVNDEIIGELQIVSNAGERRLEYHFIVTGNDNYGTYPQTLEAFTELARTNCKEARRIFASAQFVKLPFMAEPHVRTLYDGLGMKAKDAQAMEAFLVGCGMKEAVSFVTDKGRDTVEITKGVFRGSVKLTVNTWGYIRVEAKAMPQWLKIGSHVLTEEYFSDGELLLEYEVDSAALHAGHNIGEICFESNSQNVIFFVEADKRIEKKAGQRNTFPKEGVAALYRMLLDYLNHSYEKEMQMARLDKKLNSYIKKYPTEIALYLIRMWLLLESDHKKEARALLEWCRDTIAKNRSEIPVEYCAFLYLDASLREDSRVTENACKIIHKYFEAVPHLMIALIELYANHEDKDEEVILYLEELQKAYGSSPLVYALAAQIYRRQPELMNPESDFTLYVFNYMVKYQCCPEFIVSSFLRKLPKMKQSRLLLSILQRLYEERKSTQVLTAICNILIRQNKIGPAYCLWYEEGIRREVQVTSLNDYYLASLQIDEFTNLPINMLLYYSYKNDLDDKTRLSLYAHVLKYYEKDSEMYKAYEMQMNQFAIEQLLAGKIDSQLVSLYENILSPELIDRRLAQVLPDLLFSKQITTSLSYACRVIIRYPQLYKEVDCPLNDGQASLPVYTDNAVVLFEDKEGNRYTDAECRIESLMYKPELIHACRQKCPNQLMLLLEDTYLLYQKQIQDDTVYEQVNQILNHTGLTEAYRHLLISRCIDYCYYQTQKERKKEDEQSRACTDEATAWLCALDFSALSVQERAKVIELYIMRNRMKEAYEAVKLYGSRLIKHSLLLKMTVCCITEVMYAEDEYLLQFGRYLIQKQQWNHTLLFYMAQHYNGTTESMLRLLLVTQEKQTDSSDLAERVMAQMMFTGNWGKLDEAFECYKKCGKISELVRRAYYVLKCHEYLSGRETMKADNMQMIEAQILKEGHEQLPKSFCLALLLYYSNSDSLTERQKRLCESLVYGYCADQVYLGCYQGLGRHIEMPHQMEGKAVIEYRADAGEQIWIEAVIKPQEPTVSQVLTEVYPGIYTGAVFLFPDEQAELTVCHRTNGSRVEAKQVMLKGSSRYARQDSFYDEICRSILLAEEKNEDELKRHCARAERRKRVVQDLFTLM